ncbi:YbjN domain-containing protein [Arsenophonus sp.]|uniref:YbjN domain-containing protein n=1 Tax=Arsenophonus sp. TaxID=1872640 RepID=UPI00387958EF
MDSICFPDIAKLREWLVQLKTSYFECDNCQALHLPHMQNIDGIFDAKVDIVENILVFSVLAELKPTSIITLLANLSQINASSLTAKAFMEINDENLPKLVVSQSFSLLAGMTCNQFSNFLQQAEEQMAAIIFEVYNNDLLYSGQEDIDDEELSERPLPARFLLH